MAFFSRRAQRARTQHKAFRTSFERLETRDVPAVTFSLSAGVLTINGSTANDSIVLHQASGRVSIDGVGTTWASTNVNSIVVNSGAGNDSVSLIGLKAQPWAKAVKVNSAAGSDSTVLLDGRRAYFSGPNQRLATTAAGSVTLNGNALDWFDTNIHDAALRQLLKTDYSDSVINRNEMIGVFRQAEHDGTVTSNEVTDLKAVANHTSLFGSFTFVADLARDVAVGNSANAHYQGMTLGNLTAGSTGAKLEKLVQKWFFGADHPNAHDPNSPNLTITYATASGTLFGASGPQYSDVHQGNIGDCYFLATLGEVALRNPNAISNMFIANGDGTYEVRFYQNGVSRWVTVDSKLPTYGGGAFIYANMGTPASNSSNVLWVALAEKAYAQLNEMTWLRPATWGGGVNSYAGIEGGVFSDVTRQVVNQTAVGYQVNGLSDDTALANAVASGKLIGFASYDQPADSNIVGDHQYIVIAYNSSTKTVTLFNPWGIGNSEESLFPGLVSLNLLQLPGDFAYWTVA